MAENDLILENLIRDMQALLNSDEMSEFGCSPCPFNKRECDAYDVETGKVLCCLEPKEMISVLSKSKRYGTGE